MKVAILPNSFPISEIFAYLDIYAMKIRTIDKEILIEMSDFDYAVLGRYIQKNGDKYGINELR